MRALFLLFLLPMTLLATPDFTPVIEHLKKEVPTEKRDPLIYFLLGLTTPHFDNYSDSDRKQEIHDLIGTGEEGLPYKPIDSAAVSNMSLNEVCSVYLYFAKELMGDEYKVSDKYAAKLFEMSYRSNYEPMQNYFKSKLPKDKDELRALDLLASIDALNSTSRKNMMLVELLTVDGVNFFDSLTISALYNFANSPLSKCSQLLGSMLHDSEEKAAKDALQEFKKFKKSDSEITWQECATVLGKYMRNKKWDVSGEELYLWSNGKSKGAGSIDQFLLYIVSEYWGKSPAELEGTTLTLQHKDSSVENNRFLKSLEYNHELFYYLVYQTDENYKPLLPYSPYLRLSSRGIDVVQAIEKRYEANMK